MINILSSNASAPSDLFVEVKRKNDEDNLQWLSRTLPDHEGKTLCVMVGGVNATSFRLRMAQSHVRSDLLPSYWSHVMLLEKITKNMASSPVYEISLEPAQGFDFPPPSNGVQKSKLGQYRDIELYPNIAVLAVPVTIDEVKKALDRFQKQRATLDAVDLMVRWLAYIWGVGDSQNPLLQGMGIPSAAMLEIVFGAAGYDLTPGLESRSSCPEAIWQAAKWWHEYYEDQNRVSLIGLYHIGHALE
ncbi:MAG TPA: hypothetical protein VGB17_04290 [Pyrinomonadaceae bacterium]|jgi:hypothetical protein